MTVREIIAAWLKANGYGWLYSDDYCSYKGCSCNLYDLMPCVGCNISECGPERKKVCDKDRRGADCEFSGKCEYHIEPGKPEGELAMTYADGSVAKIKVPGHAICEHKHIRKVCPDCRRKND